MSSEYCTVVSSAYTPAMGSEYCTVVSNCTGSEYSSEYLIVSTNKYYSSLVVSSEYLSTCSG